MDVMMNHMREKNHNQINDMGHDGFSESLQHANLDKIRPYLDAFYDLPEDAIEAIIKAIDGHIKSSGRGSTLKRGQKAKHSKTPAVLKSSSVSPYTGSLQHPHPSRRAGARSARRSPHSSSGRAPDGQKYLCFGRRCHRLSWKRLGSFQNHMHIVHGTSDITPGDHLRAEDYINEHASPHNGTLMPPMQTNLPAEYQPHHQQTLFTGNAYDPEFNTMPASYETLNMLSHQMPITPYFNQATTMPAPYTTMTPNE